MAEELIRASEVPEKLVLRLPRVLGPYMNLSAQNSGFVKMMLRLLEDQDIKCFIPDAKYNNYICTESLAEFIATRLAQPEWPPFDRVNIGATEELTMLEILNALKEGMGSRSEIFAEGGQGEPACARVDVQKACSAGLLRRDERAQLRKVAAALKERMLRGGSRKL